MKLTIRSLLVAAVFVLSGTAVAYAQETSHPGADQLQGQEKIQASNSGAKDLPGAWKVTITPEAGGPPPFVALFLFNADGGVTETDFGPAAPGQPVSIFSAGLGEWEKGPRKKFTITYTQLQSDQLQNFVGTFRGRITAELNAKGTELTGDLVVEFFDPFDNLVFTGAGTISGKRLPVVGAK